MALTPDEVRFATRVLEHGLPPRRAPLEQGDLEIIEHVMRLIARVEINWDREGSGPGSRFEGTRRELAQAVTVVSYYRSVLLGVS